MTNISIPTKINIPDKIEIRLVRNDILETSNIFRIIFEVSIALFGGILGSFLSIQEISSIHWILFAILLAMSITSLVFWIRYNKKARVNEISSESSAKDLPIRANGFYTNIGLSDVSKVEELIPTVGIVQEKVTWHNNKYKTSYKTLKINNLNNEDISEFISLLDKESINYIDMKIFV